MEYTEFEDLIAQSTAYLRACNERANRDFGIGEYARYEYDLHRNEIWWSNPGDPKVRGKVIIVGSISTISNTWMWAWANPHFDDVERGPIDQVKVFGEREGISKLTEEKWPADEVDGWEMTSVSARLLEAQGAYSSPNSSGRLFLLYNSLEFVPEEEREKYMPLKRNADDAGDGGKRVSIQLINGNLLEQDVEVIVNAWNRNLIPWWLLLPQGVSGAIKKRGGYGPFRELRKCGVLPLGGAAVTRAGRLPFKAIIHVAGIGHLWVSSEKAVRQSVRSALTKAKEMGAKSIAFPLIGAGTGGGTPDEVERMMREEIEASDFEGRVVVVRYARE